MNFADIVQSADWKTEKHVPVIDAPDSVKVGEKFAVQVTVGKEIAHPNTTEHHIRWIRLFFMPDGGKFAYDVAGLGYDAHGEAVEGPNKGPVYCEPSGQAIVKLNTSGTLIAAAYCNIHGVWESSKRVQVEA